MPSFNMDSDDETHSATTDQRFRNEDTKSFFFEKPGRSCIKIERGYYKQLQKQTAKNNKGPEHPGNKNLKTL
jgi:hypothetical protein